MIVPIVLALLKKLIGERGLNASSLSSMLSSQGPNLSGALDSRITGALGYASPAAFLGATGGRVSDAARGVSAGLATETGATMAAGAGARTAAMASTTTAAPFGVVALAALGDRRRAPALLVEPIQRQVRSDTRGSAGGEHTDARDSASGEHTDARSRNGRAAGQSLFRNGRCCHRRGGEQDDREACRRAQERRT